MTYYHAIIEYKENDKTMREVITYDQLDDIEIRIKASEFKNKTLITPKGYRLDGLKECRLRIFESNKSAVKYQEEQNNIEIDIPGVVDSLYFTLDKAICCDGFGKEITSRYF